MKNPSWPEWDDIQSGKHRGGWTRLVNADRSCLPVAWALIETFKLPSLCRAVESERQDMNDTSVERRMAEALLRTNSPDYTVRAGATLDELSRFAKEGDLQSVSTLYNLYRIAAPADERKVREAAPVKILNQFFYRAEQNSTEAVRRWQEDRPGWRRELEAALPDPVAFETVVRSMAIEIKGAEAGHVSSPSVVGARAK
jgi:hypothetical protein